ncbi:MAG: PBP1A family penicillin-binding protein [Phenylobacterium sp.]|uniref:transglycosylase domain-containing protein n=1 Tax=Phenylobacterium sp. TaxID=1871053 RepID=UPI002736C6DD|nr:PBP1A family penicillin-binding protein [Phenylobacterium sp.]MDP3747801.1 PBP1A family penicillin-binding protein [Phenylobacterium sp.]
MIVFAAAASLLAGAPELPRLPEIRRDPQVTYVDRSGAMLGVRGGRYGPPVDLAKLPPHVPAAFIAIEDRRFYEHTGFDPVGIGRAIIAGVSEGRATQGASTITQQLARNLFLTSDRTVERKAMELLYAVQLERTYSKRQILALYLSRVYFGGGAYGLEAASQRYFNKPAARLTIQEAATLAGVLKSPTNYNPAEQPQRAAQRAALVLNAMVEIGAITPAQRAKASARPLKVAPSASSASAQYFVDWLDGQRRQLVGQPKQDVVVETTLDLGLESVAAATTSSVLARHQAQQVSQAALVAVDGQGRVRAMVGGVDYAKGPFNRAVTAKRQAGSAWKPFVYLAALEAGRVPDMPVVDEPLTIGTWSPRNYNEGYLGPITLQVALAQSINTVAARLADEVGRPNVAAAAHRVGIVSTINTDPAMALGTTLVSPLEMAQAYATFSNGGYRVSAYGIERIRTTGGTVLYQRKAAAPQPVVANPPLSDLNLMLRTVIVSGTGTRAAIPGYDLAGKTGTTSDYKDAWFAGYTGGFTTVVWMGRDDGAPMGRVTGGGAPAELWRSFMSVALKRVPKQPIPVGPPAAAPLPPPPIADPIDALVPPAADTPEPPVEDPPIG